MLSIGLRLGTSAVSRLTISSHRRCALRSVSLAGMLVPYVGAARSALVRAHPTRRRARIIMGGAACRGRYGPGRQSPVSPYKLGNRLRLATFPPVRNVSPCRVRHAARTCSVGHAAASTPGRHQPTGGPSSSSSCQDIRHVPIRLHIVHRAHCTAQVRMANKNGVFLPRYGHAGMVPQW
jgi:hypothetical protein